MSDRRFPRSVYGAGEEPDPRFSLANERTFLAWIRTSLALVAAGLAISALPVQMAAPLRTATVLLLLVAGIASSVQAWLGWRRTEQAMRRLWALPSSGLKLPVAVIVALVAVISAVGIFT